MRSGNLKRILFSLYLLILVVPCTAPVEMVPCSVGYKEYAYYRFDYTAAGGWSNGTLWNSPSQQDIYILRLVSSDLDAKIHATWLDGNFTLYMGHFDDGAWTSVTVPMARLNGNMTMRSDYAHRVDDAGNDHLWWLDGTSGDIFYSVYNGSLWSNPIKLVSNFYSIRDLQLLDDGTMHIISGVDLWIGNTTFTTVDHQMVIYRFVKIIAHGNGTIDLLRHTLSHVDNADLLQIRSRDNGLTWSGQEKIIAVSDAVKPGYHLLRANPDEPFVVKGNKTEVHVLYTIRRQWEADNQVDDAIFETLLCYTYYDGVSWIPQVITTVTEPVINKTLDFVMSSDGILHRFWKGWSSAESANNSLVLYHDILTKNGDLVSRKEITAVTGDFLEFNTVIMDSGGLQIVVEIDVYEPHTGPISLGIRGFDIWAMVTGMLVAVAAVRKTRRTLTWPNRQ